MKKGEICFKKINIAFYIIIEEYCNSQYCSQTHKSSKSRLKNVFILKIKLNIIPEKV